MVQVGGKLVVLNRVSDVDLSGKIIFEPRLQRSDEINQVNTWGLSDSAPGKFQRKYTKMGIFLAYFRYRKGAGDE